MDEGVGSPSYPAWGLSWTYDRYGNRTAQTNTAGSVPSDSLTISTTTNQVTGSGYSYDAAGNMTGDALNTMTYDAASRLISSSNGSSSGAYAYDGKGIRINKCVPNCSSPTTTTVYIFAAGKVLAEYDNGAAVGSPSREYIYSGNAQIAKLSGGTTTYYHQDHLSNRVITSSTGTVVEQMGHLPYGENWYDTGSDKWRFTSYERDAESGNDYAMARYNSNRFGRFTSPDPLSGNVGNPQSLNHYAYAGNDPINLVDPTGLSSCNPADYTLQNPMPPSCNPSIETDAGGSCSLDGISTDCGIMGFGGGDAVACPNNVCQGFGTSSNGDTSYVYFTAFAGGTSGYFDGADLAQGIWEWDGRVLNAKGWQNLTQGYSDQMQAKLAAILGVDPSALSALGLRGGNANFAMDPGDWANFITSDSSCQSGSFGIRCSDQNLHFDVTGGIFWVHMDSADPYSGIMGALDHFFVDLLGGNTIYQAGVPHR